MRSHTEWPYEKYDVLRYGDNVVVQKDFGWDFVMRHRNLAFEVIEGELKGKVVKIPLDVCLDQVERYSLAEVTNA